MPKFSGLTTPLAAATFKSERAVFLTFLWDVFGISGFLTRNLPSIFHRNSALCGQPNQYNHARCSIEYQIQQRDIAREPGDSGSVLSEFGETDFVPKDTPSSGNFQSSPEAGPFGHRSGAMGRLYAPGKSGAGRVGAALRFLLAAVSIGVCSGAGLMWRRPLMAGVLTGSALLGMAAMAMTALTPSAPSDRMVENVSNETSQESDTLFLSEDPPMEAALQNDYWREATLGSDSAVQEPLVDKDYLVAIEIAPGDTLMAVLQEAGIGQRTAYNIITAMTPIFDPRNLRPKQAMTVALSQPAMGEDPIVQALRFAPDNRREIVITRNRETNDFSAEESIHPVTTHWTRSEGTIENSLYVAATDAGVPLSVLGSMINIFSFDVDFQREIQPGDSFKLMYSEDRTASGHAVDYGDIAVAEMTVSGQVKRFYRFEDNDGFIDYYDENGQSVRRALLRTPVEGARISSGYGQRVHPVLGYTRMHRGLDFAAPTGTPIYAAGDGVVEEAGWKGSYGRYIRIRHNGTYKTAYAHLSRIDALVKPGARVQQRQVIGYVGSTGRSTGPHLHYEVIVDGRQVNPLGVKLPTGKRLSGDELARFQRERAEIDRQVAQAPTTNQFAAANED